MHQQQELLSVFGIAGVVCRIECPPDRFWSLFSPRYADFVSREAPAISLSRSDFGPA